jgi:hypothetical protein
MAPQSEEFASAGRTEPEHKVTNSANPWFGVEDTQGRLQSSLDALEWGLSLVAERWIRQPPREGDWSVATNLAHIAVYEERIAAPVLESVRDGGDGTNVSGLDSEGEVVPSGGEDWFDAETAALAVESLEVMMERLRQARYRQIVAVGELTEDRLNKAVVPFWGRSPLHSAGWVAAKTFQHTLEHGNSILRVALFSPK